MHIHLLPPKLRRAFIALCNVFVITGSNPVQWNQCYIKLIPKEPNASTPGRMRQISLLEIPRKLVCDIKQRKIVNFWREAGIISPDQFAFTAGRSTAEAAMIKKLLADRAKHYKDNIVMLDIDLSQAYDTVEQWIVEVALRRMGTPYAFINMLTHLHSNHKVSTYTGYGSTPGIYPDRGACPQGAPESCAIFLAIMDIGLEITKKANIHSYTISNVDASQIAYCDDCTYTAKGSTKEMGNVTHALAAFNHIGSLKINYFKGHLRWVGRFSKKKKNGKRAGVIVLGSC
jgi:hypothetical protein